ncbi:F-box/kelch-repeat protein SKIP6-like [Tasmannia lanceolata]|uniref:F-box/kelch-repeat protein SKIP6-like n=1 Tax=Tasmannia lanceolata TaxID=3420 RepID=UPI0040647E95
MIITCLIIFILSFGCSLLIIIDRFPSKKLSLINSLSLKQKRRNMDVDYLLPNLPNDVALQCITRVAQSFHPNLSLVCRSWRSLLRSPLFFTTRFNLNCTQQFLYVEIPRLCCSSSWLILDRYGRYLIRKVHPVPPVPLVIGSATVVLGHLLFIFRGSTGGIPSSNIWVFNARLNSWDTGPRMRIAREYATAGAVYGKIYVFGGCLDEPWAEVFDPDLGSWMDVPSPVDVRERRMYSCVVLGGKLFGRGKSRVVVFDPDRFSWSHGSIELDSGWDTRGAVVDGILCCYDVYGKIWGYVGKIINGNS